MSQLYSDIYLDELPDDLIIQLYIRMRSSSNNISKLNDRYRRLYEIFKGYIYDGMIPIFDIFRFYSQDASDMLQYELNRINSIEPDDVTYHPGMFYFVFQGKCVEKRDADVTKKEISEHLHGIIAIFFDGDVSILEETHEGATFFHNDRGEWVFVRYISTDFDQTHYFNFDTDFRRLWREIPHEHKHKIMRENGYI